MKKSIATAIIIIITICFLAVIVIGSKSKNSGATEEVDFIVEKPMEQVEHTTANIYYWGTTCPYCHDVIDWMEENNIEEHVQIIKKEVYNNQANSLELSQNAQSCGINTSAIGVPFLFTTDGKCLIGKPDIVNYLSDKAGLFPDNEATEFGKEVEL